MATNTITSADCTFLITIAGLFTSPVQLQGFAADRAFETAAVDVAELVMGVDGNLSAGWVPYICPMTVSVMPDSLSSTVFESWAEAEVSGRVKLRADGVIDIPGTGRRYTLTKGFMTNYTPIPPAARVLQARSFGLSWNRVSAAPR